MHIISILWVLWWRLNSVDTVSQQNCNREIPAANTKNLTPEFLWKTIRGKNKREKFRLYKNEVHHICKWSSWALLERKREREKVCVWDKELRREKKITLVPLHLLSSSRLYFKHALYIDNHVGWACTKLSRWQALVGSLQQLHMGSKYGEVLVYVTK